MDILLGNPKSVGSHLFVKGPIGEIKMWLRLFVAYIYFFGWGEDQSCAQG